MAFPQRELTDAEMEEFVKENNTGILCFAVEEPYGIPRGFMYKKGTVILGFSDGGSKLDCVKSSPKVCFTVCRPRKTTPDLQESCTTVMFEGELEKLTDRAYYGLPPLPEGVNIISFGIKVNELSSRKCLQEPCELLAGREASK